jgi:hypothetical protein
MMRLLIFAIIFGACQSASPDKGSMEQNKTEEILTTLDNSVGVYYSQFLRLDDGYVLPIDVRMNLFAKDDKWALVIERVGYHNRDIHCFLELFYFGNCLIKLDTVNGDVINAKYHVLCSEANLNALTPADNPDYFELISPETGVNKIQVRDSSVDVVYDKAVYEEHGISLSNPQGLANYVSLLRILDIKHNTLFRATESELHECIPADLPLLMRIDSWHHTDMVKPSEQVSYQKAAQILESKDTSLWNYSAETNTHWKNWPDAGGL